MSLIKANLTHHLRRHNGLKWGSGPRPACTKSQLPSRETWQGGGLEQQAALRPHLATFQVAAAALSLRDWELGRTFATALTFGQVTLQTEEVRNNRSQVDINMVKYLSDIYRCCISTVCIVCSCTECAAAAFCWETLWSISQGKCSMSLGREGGITRPSFTRHPQTMPHNHCLHFWHQYSQ